MIFWFIITAGSLFFFSFIYFYKSFLTSFRHKNSPGGSFNYLKLVLSLLCLSLSYYAIVLIRNHAIFYFPSPYKDDHFSMSNLTFWVPFILVVVFPVLLISNIKIIKLRAWNSFAKGLLTVNNVIFIILLGLFAYWRLFGIS